MSNTVSFSLPKQQIQFVDSLVDSYGYANRSEFLRTILRFLSQKPELLQSASVFPFFVPQEKSKKKILSDFKKTNKYSPAFLKDLKEGLENSDLYK